MIRWLLRHIIVAADRGLLAPERHRPGRLQSLYHLCHRFYPVMFPAQKSLAGDGLWYTL